jgi:hypothetical protein
VFIARDFKSNDFGSAHSTGVSGAFCVSVHSAQVPSSKARGTGSALSEDRRNLWIAREAGRIHGSTLRRVEDAENKGRGFRGGRVRRREKRRQSAREAGTRRFLCANTKHYNMRVNRVTQEYSNAPSCRGFRGSGLWFWGVARWLFKVTEAVTQNVECGRPPNADACFFVERRECFL